MLDETEYPPDLAPLRKEPEFLDSLKMRDAEYRLDNLYYIRDSEGQTVRFKRNPAQIEFYKAQAARNVLPKARKLGFSTLIELMIADRCIFRFGHMAGIIDRTLDDAVDKLTMIRFAYENLPRILRDANPL